MSKQLYNPLTILKSIFIHVRTQCFFSFEFLGVTTMRVKNKPRTVTAKNDCMIRDENFRILDLQSFHIEHSLHLACRDCIKYSLDSLSSAAVTYPYLQLQLNFTCSSHGAFFHSCEVAC